MSLYLIGDIQGCDSALGRLLNLVDFSPSRDKLILLGDLVNRGPSSLAVLRRLRALDGAVSCILGNHDLHLLAVSEGVRKMGRSDTLFELLGASDALQLLDWLRQFPLALFERGVLMVHAGVLPSWSVSQVLDLSAEVQMVLQERDWALFLEQMYGNEPNYWDEGLQGSARLRVIVNALTRLRLCTAEGVMEFDTKDSSGGEGAPSGFMPWFDVPNRKTAGDVIAFGHWSALGWIERDDVISLDTGCVWGGSLSALRLGLSGERELIQVKCPQIKKPSSKHLDKHLDKAGKKSR